MMTEPLPCMVCGMQPEPAFRDGKGTHQPYGATMFDAGSGHYGSTVWDEGTTGRSLLINICDSCLTANKSRVAVVTTVRRAPKVEFTPWNPDE